MLLASLLTFKINSNTFKQQHNSDLQILRDVEYYISSANQEHNTNTVKIITENPTLSLNPFI